MKKVYVVVAVMVAVVALVVWVASWFRAPEAVATSGALPWPGGLGPLEAARERYPRPRPNAACAKLKSLASALPKNEVVDNYVEREIVRGELTIGNAPALPDVSAIRELLLREPVVWERAGFADFQWKHVDFGYPHAHVLYTARKR
jgi:hypothetical protein